MLIKIVGSGTQLTDLETLVNKALAELALDDAVTVSTTDDTAYKLELGITENPALAIEEESIDFRDMIFQGEVPAYDEIKSMFISILGDEEDHGGGGCGSGGCGTCDTGCGSEEETHDHGTQDEGESCGTGCGCH
ncbi:hypothetical protein H7170_03295 [Candidatus Gracilibacteria bacterium]|nr:hypothetical protein [Candidatus Gracilibacteria bacterium]